MVENWRKIYNFVDCLYIVWQLFTEKALCSIHLISLKKIIFKICFSLRMFLVALKLKKHTKIIKSFKNKLQN